MWPWWRRSAELRSRGTSPSAALTCAAEGNRLTSSTNARKLTATTGPMPGTVCSRRTTASCGATATSCASSWATSLVSCSNVRTSGASVARRAGEPLEARDEPRAGPLRHPLAGLPDQRAHQRDRARARLHQVPARAQHLTRAHCAAETR